MAEYIGTDDPIFKDLQDINALLIDRRDDADYLDGKWRFDFFEDFPEKVPTSEQLKYSCEIPSSVYMNMYGAGLLPHPYEDSNSRLFRDLDEKIWYFGRKFKISGERKNCRIYLCCEGIAYYSEIWLNGRPLVYHEGMFGGPNAEITDYVNSEGENEIIIRVLAANFGKKDTFSLWNNEGTNREIVPWNIMHDNATSNGDFTIIGIWNRVRIEYLNKYHLARPYFTTEETNRDGSALIRLETEICDGSSEELRGLYGNKEGTFALAPQFAREIYKDDSVILKTSICDKETGEKVFEDSEEIRLIDFEKSFGTSKYTEQQFFDKEIKIRNPKIWDPEEKGRANLYEAVLELYHGSELCDRQRLNLGIRKVTAERAAGRKFRAAWQNWQFVVNGRKIFIKGINWTPFDYLYDISPEKYRTYLEMIKNMGADMVRVWSGGGMPETDYFYDICDELGLMVWQDHFPANTISTKGWPTDVLESQEALNIYRMRKHPSLVLHCGGNEINPYTEGNAMALETAARLKDMLDPDRIFHRAALDMGSAHIYNDMEPVWYEKAFSVLPFLGESGIHSFPSYETLCECISGKILNETLDLSSPENLGKDPGLLNHFSEFIPERVPRMLARASQMTDLSHTGIREISRATQTAAYEFYQIMVQSMKKSFPVTTGAMPWVFKRPWPTVGVQIADGFGRPLMQYYAIQNAFKRFNPIIISEQLTLAPFEKYEFRALVPQAEKLPEGCTLTVKIYGPDLEEKYSKTAECSENTLLTGEFQTDETYRNRFFYVTVTLKKGEEILGRSTYTPKVTEILEDYEKRKQFREKPSPNLYFDRGPWLIPQTENAPSALLKSSIVSEKGEVIINIENISKVPAIFTEVRCENKSCIYVYDDNYFTLEPGETKTVKGFACRQSEENITPDDFCITPMNKQKEK